MKARKHPPLNHQIYAEASDWLVEFRSGDIDAAGRKEFYGWLRTSPEHVRAYLELAAIWDEGSNLDGGRAFDVDSLMKEVQADTNVISLSLLGAQASDGMPITAKIRSYRLIKWSSVAAGVAALLIGAWVYQQHNVYATSIGEQRTLALADGSRIELNAASRVRVRFSEHERDVDLLEGQVMFEVAKDPGRPFVVRSDTAKVTAVGTQFDVYVRSSQTTVTVVEGRVVVTPAVSLPSHAVQTDRTASNVALNEPQLAQVGKESDAARFFLAAGEQAVISPKSAAKDPHADIPAATAWTRGHLVFQGVSLQRVAEEFNRYNTRRLIIQDPELANFKITGIFSSTDLSSLVRFLEARPGIMVVQQGGEIRVLKRT